MGILFIVDDDKHILLGLKYWFGKKGYKVYTFENSKLLYDTLETVTPNFILMDVNLDCEYGFDVCKHLKEYLHSNSTIYLWSSHSNIFQNLNEYHADGFIQKPVDLDALALIIAPHMPNEAMLS